MTVVVNPVGGYRFLASEGRPFSAGVASNPGFDLAHLTLRTPLPLEAGITFALDHVTALGRPPQAIAGFELRIPEPLTAVKFDFFNERYVEFLRRAGILVDGLVPSARTNVSPVGVELTEPMVHAVSYSIPSSKSNAAYLLSGVPEDKPGGAIGMADSIWNTLSDRLRELDATLDDASVLQLYCTAALENVVAERVLARARNARRLGIHWFPSQPPVVGLDLEIDVRSMGSELFL